MNIGCAFYFDDTKENLDNSTLYWDNAIIGINSLMYNSSYYDFYENTTHFVFGGEVYSGWFNTWGGWETWEKDYRDRYLGDYTKQFEQMLADKRSFSMYMPHGGTSFGLTAGFNYITSYDYYAPITEQGIATTNYHIFRSLAMNYTQKVPIKIPAPI
jgi:beta-galactosidase